MEALHVHATRGHLIDGLWLGFHVGRRGLDAAGHQASRGRQLHRRQGPGAGIDAGLFTVADMSGEGEMARGEFMRFFAETPWYPTALLPSQGVQWAAVDDTSAKATIVDGSIALTLLFRFNDAGLIDSVRADARGGMIGKEIVMRPWECGLSNYQVRDGMTVPICGEAAWVRPDGRKTYFHGTVKTLTYQWLPRTSA